MLALSFYAVLRSAPVHPKLQIQDVYAAAAYTDLLLDG